MLIPFSTHVKVEDVSVVWMKHSCSLFYRVMKKYRLVMWFLGTDFIYLRCVVTFHIILVNLFDKRKQRCQMSKKYTNEKQMAHTFIIMIFVFMAPIKINYMN